MAFDYKKEYREFYMPGRKPQIIEIPEMNFIAVRGEGSPNERGGAYQQAVSVLYAIAYTLKMSYKGGRQIKGFFEYVVPPLEGFWWQENTEKLDYSRKDLFQWISVIRLPDFVTKQDFLWAVEEAGRRKKINCQGAWFMTLKEGLCVQCMHVGTYDDEPETVAEMERYVEQMGYENDFSAERLHHEIYLSDPNRTALEKCKTIIRHPVRKHI